MTALKSPNMKGRRAVGPSTSRTDRPPLEAHGSHVGAGTPEKGETSCFLRSRVLASSFSRHLTLAFLSNRYLLFYLEPKFPRSKESPEL